LFALSRVTEALYDVPALSTLSGVRAMSSQGITLSAPLATGEPKPASGARLALTLLLLINLFNYIDRFVLAAVVPEIKKDGKFFEPDDNWVEAKMGLLSTAFMVSYMLFAPVFGVLADRMSRWWLIGIGVGIWSLASGASGLATGFAMLLITRIVVGVGEAVYGPAAPALISDIYPVSRRGSVLAWFYAAIPVGAAIGFVLGGLALGWTERLQGAPNWRWAFYIVVVPGLVFAVWSFFMREPPRGQADAVTEPHHATMADYWVILRTPSYVYATLGYTALCFVQGGVGFWTPTYVHLNRGQPDLEKVNSIFGAILVVGGLLSTLLGGWVGDRLRGKIPGSYLIVSGVGSLLAFPLLLAFLVVDFPYAWMLIFLVIFWMFFNTGPVNTVLANVVHPSVRASGFALNILVIHLFGDAISPTIMGYMAGVGRNLASREGISPWMAEILSRRDGMDFSIGLTSLFLLVAGILWLMGARHLERDTALAPKRLAPRPITDTPETAIQPGL
jgi:MFS transporter, Spinster family, sphingosine-1-phosphate transporter